MLDEIIARTKADLPSLMAREETVMVLAASAGPTQSLAAALSAPGLSVIAEVKRRSPSRGEIDGRLDPRTQATRYAAGGAAAISVLTEPHHFDGSPADLSAVTEVVDCPVLRKDFIVHPLQIWEARSIGADAVLLIVAVLADPELERLLGVATEAGLEALVEVHSAEETRRAHAAGATIVGVNNRDLTSFEVDLATAETLADVVGDDVIRVAESGIWTADDAVRMASAGYNAVLVGEALVRASDPGALVAEMRSALT